MKIHAKAVGLVAAVALGVAGSWAVWFSRDTAAGPAARYKQAPVGDCALAPADVQAPHPGMVWVPGGRFTPGDTVYPEERAHGQVHVSGFWMDRTEVTNDDFARFVQATGYITVAERPVDPSRHVAGIPTALLSPGALVFSPPDRLPPGADIQAWWRYVPGANWRRPGGPGTHIQGRGAYPVVAVAIEDAQAYAAWAGRALPSEAQWEWAARGAQDVAPPSHEQPRQANTWQGRFPLRNTSTDGFAGLAPVGCFEPNTLGLYDMVGNVWELTGDLFGPHRGESGPPISLHNLPLRQYVIKGGSYLCSPDYCVRYRPGSRQPQDEDLGTSHVGFRTVLMTPGPGTPLLRDSR